MSEEESQKTRLAPLESLKYQKLILNNNNASMRG